MATEVGSAFVSIVPSTRGFGGTLNKQIATPSTKAGKVSGGKFRTGILGSLKGIGGVVAGSLAIGAGVNFFKDAVTGASDLNETMSKVGVVFGAKALPALEKFSSTAAKNLGQSKQEALDAAATFGLFGKSAGLTGPPLAKFSTDLVSLSGDMASFSNTTPVEAAEAIGAALRGESEPIRRYGVLLNDAALKAEAMGLGLLKPVKSVDTIRAAQIRAMTAQRAYNESVAKSGKGSNESLTLEGRLALAKAALSKSTAGTIPPLTAQQKVLASQSLIFKQTSDAQGDFARTSGGLANQQRILAAQIANTKAQMGAAFLPIVTKVVAFLNTRMLPAIRSLGPVMSRMGAAVKAGFEASLPALRVFGAFVLAKVVPVLVRLGESLQARAIPALIALGKYVKSDVVPALVTFGTFVKVRVLPVLVQIGDFIADRVVPALVKFGALLVRNKGVLIDVAIAVVALKVAMVTYAAVQAAIGLGTAIIRFVQLARAIGIARAIQLQFNLAMVANPIGIVVVAIAVLAVAFVIAYRRSERFRNIVNGTFAALKATVLTTLPIIRSIITTVIHVGAAVGRFAVRVVRFFLRIHEGVVTRVQAVITFIRTLPAKVLAAVGNLGKVLFNAGRAIITGLINGIKGKFVDVKNTLTGLTGKLTSWKGPASKDATILEKPGQLLIQGFMAGIDSQTPVLKKKLQGITKTIPKTVGIGRPVGGTRLATTGVGGGAGVHGGTVHLTVNNPLPERAAESTANSLRRLSWTHGLAVA